MKNLTSNECDVPEENNPDIIIEEIEAERGHRKFKKTKKTILNLLKRENWNLFKEKLKRGRESTPEEWIEEIKEIAKVIYKDHNLPTTDKVEITIYKDRRFEYVYLNELSHNELIDLNITQTCRIRLHELPEYLDKLTNYNFNFDSSLSVAADILEKVNRLEIIKDNKDSRYNRFLYMSLGAEIGYLICELGDFYSVIKPESPADKKSLTRNEFIKKEKERSKKEDAARTKQIDKSNEDRRLILEEAVKLRKSKPSITDADLIIEINKKYKGKRGYGVDTLKKLIPEFTKGGELKASTKRKTPTFK